MSFNGSKQSRILYFLFLNSTILLEYEKNEKSKKLKAKAVIRKRSLFLTVGHLSGSAKNISSNRVVLQKIH